MEAIVKIQSLEALTHDVIRIRTEKPDDLDFTPGQATEVAINQPEWRDEGRPFTFTSLPEEDYLEFTIKTYPEHEGVTHELRKLDEGNELILRDIFGDIRYKGPGVFIAGGAGVTPFIAIFKKLKKEQKLQENRLVFANKTQEDIILKDDFEQLLGSRFINVLSEENRPEYESGFVDAELISKYVQLDRDMIYLCGPDPMMEAVEQALDTLNFPKERLIREAF